MREKQFTSDHAQTKNERKAAHQQVIPKHAHILRLSKAAIGVDVANVRAVIESQNLYAIVVFLSLQLEASGNLEHTRAGDCEIKNTCTKFTT